MGRYYKVDNEKKTITITNIEKITAEEKKKALNYKDFGFNLIIQDTKKSTATTPEQKAKNPYSEQNVKRYLKEEGTERQQKQYEKLYNAVMKNKETGEVMTYKKDSKDGKHKAGDTRVIGHVNALSWFEKEFPEYKTCEWVKQNFPDYEA